MKSERLLELKTNIHAYSCSPDVIIFTETWLSADIGSEELGLTGYTIHRKDRDVARSGLLRGGGVLVALRSHIPAHLVPTNTNLEQVFVRMVTPCFRLIIGAVYIKPGSHSSVYGDFN